MKTLVPFLLAAGVVSAVAHLGDPLAQLETRYGERFAAGSDSFDSAAVVYGFDKAGASKLRSRGFEIFAVISGDDRCQELVYQKLYGARLEQNEVQGILISNSMGMTWSPVSGNVDGSLFVRTDGAIALIPEPNRMEIMSVDRAELRNISVSS